MFRILEDFVAGLCKSNVRNFCDLETVDDKYTFVSTDGSMMTLVRYRGLAQIPGAEERQKMMDKVHEYFQTVLANPGHGVQVTYQRDPRRTRRNIAAALKPAHETSKRLKLDVGDILSEKIDVFDKWCVHETCFVALWTYPSTVTKDTAKKHREKVKDAAKERPASIADAMDPFVLIPEMRARHATFVDGFVRAASAADGIAEKLDVHEACREMRFQLDPEFTSDRWSPHLPGDKSPPRIEPTKRGDTDESGYLYEKISSQLLRRGHERTAHDEVRIGSMYYTPILVEVFPQDVQSFGELLRKVRPDIPWRISYHFAHGSLSTFSVIAKRQLSIFLAWASAENRMIRDEFDQLSNFDNRGSTICTLKMMVLTWADSQEELRGNVEVLSQAVQEWGLCDVMTDTADPSESVITSAVGVSHTSPSATAWPPCADIVTMLPMDRPATIWPSGAALYRTRQDTPYPYEPGSSKQNAFIDLIFAGSGAGKSVHSNALNFSLALQAGKDRLPRITVIDIGPSSAGLVALLRDALPENQKHLAVYHKMVMSKEHSINPFDLQLGSRVPAPPEKAFLSNLLELLATPAGRDKPYENMAELVSMVIDETYKEFHDTKNPKPYRPGAAPLVDEMIAKYSVLLEEGTTWWEITYEMFRRGEMEAATNAQRFAVPLLSDIATVANQNQTILQAYGPKRNLVTDSGESLLDAFSRMLSSAVRDYPIFARETRLDFSNARIIALDLNDVAKLGGSAENKQTAVCYMLARYVGAKDFYLTEDYIGIFNDTYVEFQRDRIRKIRKDTKRIVYDEFHRTKGQHAARNQVVVDQREGRKWGVQVALISQVLTDFSADMLDNATNIYVMGSPTQQEVKRIKDTFGLSNTEHKMIASGQVHGPILGGSSFLFKFKLGEGWRSQVLRSTPGPLELWAYSTTIEDRDLLIEVQKLVGTAKKARQVLARVYPSGSAKKHIEQVQAEMEEKVFSEAEHEDISIRLAREAVQQYRDIMAREKTQEQVARRRQRKAATIS